MRTMEQIDTINKTIISINVGAKWAAVKELEETLRRVRPIACLIQDLPRMNVAEYSELKERLASKYKILTSNNRLDRNSDEVSISYKADTAMIIWNRVRIERIDLDKTVEEEHERTASNSARVVCVRMQLMDRESEFIIFNVYIRPRDPYAMTERMLKWMKSAFENHDRSRCIIMGDLNCCSPEWTPMSHIIFMNKETNRRETEQHSIHHYQQIKLTRGRQLSHFIRENKLICINNIKDGPTFQHKRSTQNNSGQDGSYLSVALCGSKAARIWNKFWMESMTESDGHKIIMIGVENPHCRFAAVRVGMGEDTLIEPSRNYETGDYETDATNNPYSSRSAAAVRVGNISATHSNEVTGVKYRYRLSRVKQQSNLFLELDIKIQKLCTNWTNLPRKNIVKRINLITEALYATVRNVQCLIQQPVSIRTFTGSSVNNYRNLNKIITKIKHLENIVRLNGRGKHKTRHSSMESLHKRQRSISKLGRLKTKLAQIVSDNSDRLNHDERTLDFRSTDHAFTTPEAWKTIRLIDDDFREEEDVQFNIKSIDELELVAHDKFPYRERDSLRELQMSEERGFDEERGGIEPLVISVEEINNAIQAIRTKNYTGVEGIRFRVFYQCIPYIRLALDNICKMAFYAAIVPNRCNTTLGKLIPKREPGKYRIVHISSALSSILEEIALKRLSYTLEKFNLNNERQYGFVTNRCRHDLLAKILEHIIKHRRNTNGITRTTIVNLDVEGAFDNISQDRLVEKIMNELRINPLRYWLRHFILNRNTIIRYNNFETTLKQVCRGVPQGSSLGPILWNLGINDIDTGILIPKQLDLLCYADDLMLIYNGRDNHVLQRGLDMISSALAKIDLRINTSKSEGMVVYNHVRDSVRHDYIIDGYDLKMVQSMVILGVPITHQLKLNTKYERCIAQLSRNTSKLYKLNQLNITNNTQSWHQLIDSYIISILVANNLPILAVDESGREWCDRTLLKVMRTIFSWPDNTSSKLIKLVTTVEKTDSIVKKLVKTRMTIPEHYNTYKYLLDQLQPRIDTAMGPWTEEVIMKSRRKHFNPDKMMTLMHLANESIYGTDKVYWMGVDDTNHSCWVEFVNDTPLQYIAGKHGRYPIPYFNNMSTLGKLVNDENIANKDLLFHNSESLVMALQNYSNHDYRIIELRETIVTNGWKINLIPGNQANRIRRSLRKYCNNNIIAVSTIDEPNLEDYIRRNSLSDYHREEKYREMRNYNTTMTRFLSSDTKTWMNISPSKLNSVNMLTLSGLTLDERGSMTTGKLNIGKLPPSCHLESCRITEEWEAHTTIHRLLNCPRFTEIRQEITDIIGPNKDLADCMKNADKRRDILRLIAWIALTK